MRRSLSVLACLSLAIAAAGDSASQSGAQVVMGPEFQVNEWTTYGQERPSVAADAAGEFVVAWQSYVLGNEDCFVYPFQSGCFIVRARRYDSRGDPLAGEFQVNVSTASTQKGPSVARSPAGGFVVAWDNDNRPFGAGDTWIRRYDSEGMPLGSGSRANADVGLDEFDADIAMDSEGNFVVVWTHLDPYLGEGGIYGRRFDSTGLPLDADFLVGGQDTLFTNHSRVARAETGEFVVVWSDGTSIWGHRFDPAGQSQGDPFEINTCCQNSHSPDVAMQGAAGFVVVWDQSASVGDRDVFARRYDTEGMAQGAAFRLHSTTAGNQFYPAVASDAEGNFLVLWASEAQDGSYRGIFGRRFDVDGQPLDAEFQVNEYTTGDQDQPALAPTRHGDFVGTWQSVGQDGSGRGVFGRLLRFPLFADGFESGDTGGWSSTQN